VGGDDRRKKTTSSNAFWIERENQESKKNGTRKDPQVLAKGGNEKGKRTASGRLPVVYSAPTKKGRRLE